LGEDDTSVARRLFGEVLSPDGVWKKGHFGQERDGIVFGKHRLNASSAERFDVSTDAQATGEHVGENNGNIREQTEPPDSSLGATVRNGQAGLIGKKKIRKVDASRGTESVKAPSSSIYIEKFKLLVSGILFELNLDESIIVNRLQKPHSQRLNRGGLNGLHVGRRSPEFTGMLPSPPGQETAINLAVAIESAKRELALSAAGNDLLNQDVAGINLKSSPSV
jgi:hypothetical protein